MKRKCLNFIVAAIMIVSIGILLMVASTSQTANQALPRNHVIFPVASVASPDPTKQPEATAARPENFKDGVWIKKYHGNFACFKFETPDGAIVITDPFCMNEIIDPDIVTESHQHEDHTNVSKLTGKYKLLTSTGEYQQNGINVTGFSGKHNKGDTECTNIIFVYKINGINIAHFASQGEYPEDEALEEMGRIDVLLLQGFTNSEYADSKLTLAECEKIILKLHPKIVIPEHGTPGMGDSLAKYLGADIEHSNNGQLVVTRSALEEIETFKIIDLDTNVTL
jgi:L-ascorbate metabolism protein UlaG (beta-lactamase superfamily)